MKRTKSFQLGQLMSKREEGWKNVKGVNKKHGQQMFSIMQIFIVFIMQVLSKIRTTNV